MESVDWCHVLKVSKDDCEEPQKEFANRAALIEGEFTNFLEHIQQKTEQISSEPPTSATVNAASRKRKMDNTSEEEGFYETVNGEELATFLEQFKQEKKLVASQPSKNSLYPSPKRMKVSDCQPSTRQSKAGSFCVPSARNYIVTRKRKLDSTSKEEGFYKAVHGEELGTFLQQFEQETKRVASQLSESNLCPSPKSVKVSDCQPSTSQSKAGSFCVPSATNYIVTRATNLSTGDKPYIKKPCNAFMLFRAAHRQTVAYELGITDSAQVNTELGRRWKMLSEEERAPYFKQALKEKKAHQAMFPGWSAKENFGKKIRERKTSFPPIHHHFGFTAPANQQPVMGLYATGPMSFPHQAPYNLDPYYQAWGPHGQAPYNQAWRPSGQAPYNQAWGPNGQVPYYQAWGPHGQAPYNQTWGPNGLAPYNQPQAPCKEPFVATFTDNGIPKQPIPLEACTNQVPNIQAPNIQAPNDQTQNDHEPIQESSIHPMETLIIDSVPVAAIPL